MILSGSQLLYVDKSVSSAPTGWRLKFVEKSPGGNVRALDRIGFKRYHRVLLGDGVICPKHYPKSNRF